MARTAMPRNSCSSTSRSAAGRRQTRGPVGIAAPAGYCVAPHAEAAVGTLHNVLRRFQLREAGPSGAGLELGPGIERGQSASLLTTFGTPSIPVLLPATFFSRTKGRNLTRASSLPLSKIVGKKPERRMQSYLQFNYCNFRHTKGELGIALAAGKVLGRSCCEGDRGGRSRPQRLIESLT